MNNYIDDTFDITTGLSDEYNNTFDHEVEYDLNMSSFLMHMHTEDAPQVVGNTCVQSLMPYRHHGQWVFDDASRGLTAEAFVCGMSEIIDAALLDAGINPKDVRKGFRLTFSASEFPNSRRLSWLRPEGSGNLYQCTNSGLIGWLCPALFLYYAQAPERMYWSVGLVDIDDV